MGNQCKGTEENDIKIVQSSQALIGFVCDTIQYFMALEQYSQDRNELQRTLKFVQQINLSQQAQVLENDHFTSLKQVSLGKKMNQKQFSDRLKQLGSVSIEESNQILNQFNLSQLQFQDLYNSINTLEVSLFQRSQQQNQADQFQVLKNKQISENNAEIFGEKLLYQMFIRISNKKFIIFQLIDHWITTIKSNNLKLIISLATMIICEIYNSIKEIIIPKRIYEILIIWMVQVIVFNLYDSTKEMNKQEHLLDFIFYYKCPIEKMMILFAQQKIMKMQYVILNADDVADVIDKILRQYPRAGLLKHQIKLIEQYVKEDWFFQLYHIVRTWSVIAQRF
ncbi:unnamed protein product (macronuclear) [Paramecium tetraurelia]|uniref:Uncharacterized protein n=1 Tax=Paramecium tetraurelia TaxID=5888 RepID=A0EEN0_PARTE|nr:uncharacterized protein GSPATT00026093001 [Paramecium tetraurelia]CAK93771.1 unnamed protein product [Paramecium tetraurelia]|eukprot:XP_001461144.1 hypothetical protein (macronuclear) [Paramecium tetraurelia strain d4-2]